MGADFLCVCKTNLMSIIKHIFFCSHANMSLVIYFTEGDLPYPVNPPPFQYQQDQGQSMILFPPLFEANLIIKCLSNIF